MRVPLRLAEIVAAPSFSEGNARYLQRKVLIVSMETAGPDRMIEAMVLVEDPARKVRFVACADGTLGTHDCSVHGTELCPDIIAAILKYNEIAIADLSPVTQLAELADVSALAPTEERPIPLRIDKEGRITFGTVPGREAGTLGHLLERLDGTGRMLLLAVSPGSFSYGDRWVRKGDLPIDVYYRRDEGTVRFSLPDSLLFDQESGVLFDHENAAVFSLSDGQRSLLTQLLVFAAPFDDMEQLAVSLQALGARVRPYFRLSGEWDGAERVVREAVPLFMLDVEEGRLYLDLYLTVDGDRVRIPPVRRENEQVYARDGRLLRFEPATVKDARRIVRRAGFRMSGDRYAAPIAALAGLLSDDSPLRVAGKVETARPVRRIAIPEGMIERSEIGIEAHPGEGWFSFSLRFPETEVPLPPESLVDAMRQVIKGNESPVVADRNGDPVVIEKSQDFLLRLRDLLLFGQAMPGERVSAAFLPGILRQKGRMVLDRFSGDEADRAAYEDIIRAFSSGTLPEVPDLPGFEVLRPYQREGVRWLTLIGRMGLGAILADEMGLGKTLQTLAALQVDGGKGVTLVIAPKTLVWSWEREVQKFFPALDRTVIDAAAPQDRARRWRAVSSGIVITSYAIAVNDIELLKQKRFRAIVVDEAQHLKNQKTKRFGALQKLRADLRLALTGTPIENHLADLWSIFQFLIPGLLGRRQDIERMEREGDAAGFARIAALTAPFVLRREKRQILPELPPVIIKEYPVDMTGTQKEIYLSHLLRGRAEYLELGKDLNKIEVLALLTKLRLAANHPMLVSDRVRDIEDSGKIALLMELIGDIRDGGGRVLVFSQFVKMLAIVEKALKKRAIPYFYMDGDTVDRRDPVDRFNRGEREVFLLSLKVGGFGLNLTGADHVVIVDPWWNPAVEEQAWSRAHRIGQRRQVVVSKIFSRGTIEEKILDLQQNKKDLSGLFLSRSLVEPSQDLIRLLAEMELRSPREGA
ncbi:MAG TPA: DEAD/DEAH box helicase [bacterium]|nr:DEAD/DEAH box helicase [bacterium]